MYFPSLVYILSLLFPQRFIKIPPTTLKQLLCRRVAMTIPSSLYVNAYMCLWGPLNVKYSLVFHSIYHLNFPPNERMCAQLSSMSLLIWSSVSSLSLALFLSTLHANCNSNRKKIDIHIHVHVDTFFPPVSSLLPKTTHISVKLVVVCQDFFLQLISIWPYKNFKL